VVIILVIIIIIIIEVREIIIIIIIEMGIIDRVVIIEIGILREITEVEIREITGQEEIIDHHRLVLRILGNIILVLLDITPVIHIKWHHLDILKVVIVGNIIGMEGIHHINLHRDLVVVVDLLHHPVIIIIMIHH